MKLLSKALSIKSLLLDPNNYRFHDLDDWKRVNDNRFHEAKVQLNATKLLRETTAFELLSLKESIRTNGFVELERIVVRPYKCVRDKYVVVEGNRRVAAIKWLLEDIEDGLVNLDADAKKRLERLSVLILDPSEPDNQHAVEVIMAIRHVGGIKEWGAYQQARLIVELLEQPGASLKSVADKLGMNSREVARRFRASNALRQMEEDEEYRDFVEPRMYSIFHEIVAQPVIREWLGWNDQEARFQNFKNLHVLYSLMCSGEDQPAKITGYADIRGKFKTIVQSERAILVVQDSDKTLDDAYRVAIEELAEDDDGSDFELSVKKACRVLETLPITTVRSLTPRQRELLLELKNVIDQRLADFTLLQVK